MTYRLGSLFSGYGGLDLGVSMVLGTQVAWVSDDAKTPAAILAHRYPGVENVGDVRQIDWLGLPAVDVLTGGFPCQDVSSAGRLAGLHPTSRSGLWSHMAYGISVLRPSLVVIENVRGICSAPASSDVEPCAGCVGDRPAQSAMRALGAVLADLAGLRYDAQWACVSAAAVGAPHLRRQIFICAWPAAHAPWDRWKRHWQAWTGQPRPAHSDSGAAADPGLKLLPTPSPFHSTNTETPEQWLARRAEVQHRTGTMHGPALGVVARSVMSGQGVLVQDGTGPHLAEPGPDGWGPYAQAVRRWEAIMGRAAPEPTEWLKGRDRLAPDFVEWQMGLPEGWVTDVPGLSWRQQLIALGNGVVPLQAADALRRLLVAMQAADALGMTA